MRSNSCDGSQIRDFVYVDDAVEAFLAAGASDSVNGEAFNVGGEEHITHRDLVKMLVEIAGSGRYTFVDWPAEKGAALLADLLDRATRPELIYSHPWQAGDVVIWDNRSVLHRATAYDSANKRRLMQRTTISNPAVLETPAYRALRQAIPSSQA